MSWSSPARTSPSVAMVESSSRQYAVRFSVVIAIVRVRGETGATVLGGACHSALVSAKSSPRETRSNQYQPPSMK
jgi:hypothetical protein